VPAACAQPELPISTWAPQLGQIEDDIVAATRSVDTLPPGPRQSTIKIWRPPLNDLIDSTVEFPLLSENATVE